MSVPRDAQDLTVDLQDKRPDEPQFLDAPVKNNDPVAQRKKAIDDKARALREENDLREVLSSQAGVRFVAKVLTEYCAIDEFAFHPNNSTMCNIAGRRQVAQQIKSLIRDADFELWVQVDREIESRRPRQKADKSR